MDFLKKGVRPASRRSDAFFMPDIYLVNQVNMLDTIDPLW